MKKLNTILLVVWVIATVMCLVFAALHVYNPQFWKIIAMFLSNGVMWLALFIRFINSERLSN